ncbi:MAG: hypothetical protein ACC634_05695, partial [Hyphomicrobiales bacterium]
IVASASRGGKRLIAVVLGTASEKFRADVAANLLDKAFARYAGTSVDFGGVTALANDASPTAKPANLRALLCPSKKQSTKPRKITLSGWGVLLGRYSTVKRARKGLRLSLVGLRGIASLANAGVVKGRKKNRTAAVLAGLSLNEVLAVCDHLAKSGDVCTTLSPSDLADPRAAWR